MIPLADIAQLLAARGVNVSLISTPVNAGRLKPAFDLAAERGHRPIRLIEIPFPCREAGLPEGCENLDLIPTKEMVINFFVAVGMLRKPVEDLVQRELQPPPSCIISDMGLHWTGEIARRLGIPRFTFHVTCCFSLLCATNVRKFNVLEGVADDETEEVPFVVPGLPHRIEITRSQMPNNLAPKKSMQGLVKEILDAEAASRGIIVNSFQELEPEYVELYEKAVGKKTWTIGPVALCVNNLSVNSQQSGSNYVKAHNVLRGNKSSVDDDKCSAWLDSMKPRSVVYVSFGSLVRQTPEQLVEIGLGLEASGLPFIWVIKAGERASEFEAWLTEQEFEVRNNGRCLVIRGWAPQLMILSHPAVGGFLTHGGWNSALEGITAGVPMLIWPLFAEQFLNEKLLVHILRIGVSIGVQTVTNWRAEEATGVLANRTDIDKAVRELMDEGQDGEDRRNRANELGEKARRAIQQGGSSDFNLSLLIQDVINFEAKPET